MEAQRRKLAALLRLQLLLVQLIIVIFGLAAVPGMAMSGAYSPASEARSPPSPEVFFTPAVPMSSPPVYGAKRNPHDSRADVAPPPQQQQQQQKGEKKITSLQRLLLEGFEMNCTGEQSGRDYYYRYQVVAGGAEGGATVSMLDACYLQHLLTQCEESDEASTGGGCDSSDPWTTPVKETLRMLDRDGVEVGIYVKHRESEQPRRRRQYLHEHARAKKDREREQAMDVEEEWVELQEAMADLQREMAFLQEEMLNVGAQIYRWKHRWAAPARRNNRRESTGSTY